MFFRFNSGSVDFNSKKEKEETEAAQKNDLDDAVYNHALKANIPKVNELIAEGASKEWAVEGYLLGDHIKRNPNLIEMTADLELREMIMEEEKNILSNFVRRMELRDFEKNRLEKVNSGLNSFQLFFRSLTKQKPFWEASEEEQIKKIRVEINC